MDNCAPGINEELKTLEQTLSFIKHELEKMAGLLASRKSSLIASRRDMWENSAHGSREMGRMVEMSQYMTEAQNQAASYNNTLKVVERYRKALESPYFGRFDFVEDGLAGEEKIYIGLCHIMDSQTHDILVYDWRAPISSIFYRYETGRAAYTSPMGEIAGEVILKRQYKIENSQLKYFFDCNVRINDEVLQEILSRNASPKMRNIVETIQKEQDRVIRDTESELLMVQGVAGSGKTSIALHRIAFLLYEGASTKLESNNIIIISPNTVFSRYISSVLPELGEENVAQMTFDELVSAQLGSRPACERRSEQLEALIRSKDREGTKARKQGIQFKGSKAFVQMLENWIRHYEQQVIPVEDVCFDGQIIATRQQLKDLLLDNKIRMPLVKRLKRIESDLLEKVHPLQKKRLEKLQKIVMEGEGHEFEEKAYSRLLSIQEARAFRESIQRFTGLDYFEFYKELFSDRELFFQLAEGLTLPEDIEVILEETLESLERGKIPYEDCGPLLLLKLLLEGSDDFPDIRQVVIDEAQDYYPVQYEVFKVLFKNAGYTVLGDIRQTIERDADKSLYDNVAEIFDKKKTVWMTLSKSYRSSDEINRFTQKLLRERPEFISFERHEAAPEVVHRDTLELLDQAVAQDIDRFLEQGYESVAVICKTREEAETAYIRLKKITGVKLVNPSDGEIEKGPMILPSYMAKGLEFDAVLVYGASRENYSDEFDRKLLYIACTRALHRLVLYHTGEKSPLIE